MQWYYEGSDGQAGPVSEEEFQSLIKDGIITHSTLVWNSAMTDWTEYGRLNTSPNSEGTDGAICAECGGSFSKNDMIKYGESYVCARCKPVFIQKIKEGVNLNKMDYAGFWIRTGAMLIDGLVMGVFFLIFVFFVAFFVGMTSSMQGGDPSEAMVFVFVGYFIFFVLVIGYEFFFIGKWGATLGKMACGLKVVSPDGEKISYLRSFARLFAKWVSGWILYIGYIMVAFDDEKQGLHDRMCSTRVIRR